MEHHPVVLDDAQFIPIGFNITKYPNPPNKI